MVQQRKWFPGPKKLIKNTPKSNKKDQTKIKTPKLPGILLNKFLKLLNLELSIRKNKKYVFQKVLDVDDSATKMIPWTSKID